MMPVHDITMSCNSTPIKKQNGGRHRLYTNEQRKDRNRQAQAAFRARRSQHAKTQKQTIAELQQLVHMLQVSSQQANERATFAEKKCLLLENENQQLKTTMDCLLTQSSDCGSPLTSQSSTLSPTVDHLPLPQQQPLPWSSDPVTLLLDECNNNHLESKFNFLNVNVLDIPPANDYGSSCDTQQPLIDNDFYLGKLTILRYRTGVALKH